MSLLDVIAVQDIYRKLYGVSTTLSLSPFRNNSSYLAILYFDQIEAIIAMRREILEIWQLLGK